MKKVVQESEPPRKSFYKLFVIIILIISVILLLFFFILTPQFIIRKFSTDGKLEASTIERLSNLRIFVLVMFVIFFGVALFCSLKKDYTINFFKRYKTLMLNVLVLLVTLLLIFLLSELALRVYYHGSKRVIAVSPMIREYGKYVDKLNNEGMRGGDFVVEKPNGTIRIVIVGDSFVYGAGIKNINDTFAYLLEKQLNERNDGVHYEVMNFGKPGDNLPQYLDRLKAKVTKYHPDIVIIGYMLYDFQIRDSEENKYKSIDTEPWTISIVGFWLRASSYAYYFLEQETNKFLEVFGIKKSNKKVLFEAYTPPENQKINAVIFHEMKKVTKENNSSIFVIIFPLISQLEDYPLKDIHGILKNVIKSQAIYVYDLQPDFSKYPTKDLIANRYDPHPNELAAKITTKELYDIIINKRYNLPEENMNSSTKFSLEMLR